MKQVIKEEGSRPIKIWTDEIEDAALSQLKNLARLPFIAANGVAAMPDVHMGIGASVGTVIATDKAIIPAAVGVDIGCGMNAVRLSLKADDLPDSLNEIRAGIERGVPLGAGGGHSGAKELGDLSPRFHSIADKHPVLAKNKMATQLGTLGSGNHFIEICLDENKDVWVMLHSGSRGVGNLIGRYFIEKAKNLMEKFHITLPDGDLAYLPQDSELFDDYVEAVHWAQDYALENRRAMMAEVIRNLRQYIKKPFDITHEAINCHHNYVAQENHFGRNLWVTRKGAIRAREGDLGIIPGSMGAKSYIVRGKGELQSYCSCSHGAGRRMSRTQARKAFTVQDAIEQTKGVNCLKDESVIDELPLAYKDIDVVMENQKDLVEVVHVLKQVMCVKGA
jgi:tRNA-splicing ligase RtcB